MKSTIAGVPVEAALLVLFDEIYQSQSVTRAAAKLDLSQPTVSVWLGKLRRALGDPLFVRTAGGMKPTPRADTLIGPAREALALLRRISGQESAFDAATARRVFRICMTDASHITLLPSLLAHLRDVAPGVGLAVTPIDASTAQRLESGDADLALGYVVGLESGFHEQALYSQDFVCLANVRHPRVVDAFTLRDFRAEAHVAVLSSTSYPMLNEAMKRQRIDRRVHLELPGFLGLAAIVSSTDLIATVPRTIGETLARTGAIRVFACPVKLPTFSVKQYWHARYHHEPGHRWLRARCAALFAQPMRYRRQR
jgi:DNA-binding transcriptional LysR family regulator